jgi:MFS family permease
MLAMFRRGMFYTFLSIYLREFLVMTVTETTLYATLPMIVNVMFQTFIWGPISDKFQRRRLLVISGEILAGIGTLVVFIIHSAFSNLYLAGFVIILGLSCVEIFWSMSNIGWSALISDVYPSKERERIMGQLTSIGGLGRIIGILLGGLLYENGLGFRNGPLFFIASFVMFFSTIPMLLAPEGGIELKKTNIDSVTENKEHKENYMLIFIIFLISLTFINFGRNSVSVPYSQFLSLDSGFNVDSMLLSFIVNTRSLAILLIGLPVGLLSKKIGPSKTLVLGISFSITALILTAFVYNMIFIFIGSFLIGAGEVLIMATSYAIASDLIPEDKRGKLFSFYNMTFFLSWGLAGTLISGPLIDFLILEGRSDFFAYQMAFLVGIIICLVGVLIYLILEIARKNGKFSS